MIGYEGPWWIAGGWAIEAFTGIQRQHGDLDASIPRADVVAFHEHVAPRLHVWQADKGSLRPMTSSADPLPDTCGNLWLRASGSDPWEYDFLLMTVESGQWTYKHDGRISLPLDDILWLDQGVRFLRPEVQLLHKAPGLRAKDQADFESCLPLLEPSDRRWLQEALEIAHPRHPWIVQL